VWTEFICLRLGSLRFHKRPAVWWMTERLVAFQELTSLYQHNLSTNIFSVESCFFLFNFRSPDFRFPHPVSPTKWERVSVFSFLFVAHDGHEWGLYFSTSRRKLLKSMKIIRANSWRLEWWSCFYVQKVGISAVRIGFRSICTLACCLSVCWLSCCIDSSRVVKPAASFCRAEE
jgi:hypothetical protein